MTTMDWTSEASGTGQYADVNGINLYYEIHGTGRPLVLLHGGLGSGEMLGPALPALHRRRPPGHPARPPGPRPHGRHRPADRRPPDGRRHRGPDHAPRAREAGRRRLLARWRRRVLHGGQAPGPGPQDGDGLDQRQAQRDLPGDAGPAGPGRAGGGGVHEGHADVRALPAGRAAAGGLRPAARQDGRVDGEGLRLQRRGPRADRCRRCSPAPMPTCSRPATRSRSSGCSAAASATAAGWARAGRTAGTRSRSCPARPTTTSSRRRS